MFLAKLNEWLQSNAGDKYFHNMTSRERNIVEEFATWLDRAAELQRAPGQSAIELLRRIRDITPDFGGIKSVAVRDEIDAVLKTADGG